MRSPIRTSLCSGSRSTEVPSESHHPSPPKEIEVTHILIDVPVHPKLYPNAATQPRAESGINDSKNKGTL